MTGNNWFRNLANMAQGMVAAIFVLVASATASNPAVINPFADVIGKWSGSGLMTYDDGSKERIACTAEHTGNATQLNLVIRCAGGDRDIRMTARLSSNAGRLLGWWDEKYFSAAGAINGVATANKISFTVSGNVNGEMIVTYSKNRQRIAISARNVPLRTLTIDMKRR
jgi:hypothetical protein